MKNCKVHVVAEGQRTKMLKISKWVVPEHSARFPSVPDCLVLNHADHITVCKPQNTQDGGYLKLTSCISEVIREHSSSVLVHLPVKPIGIDLIIAEVCGRLESTSQVSVVGLFGMGGAGKTTLSKRVYNLSAFKYAKSCYLEEVKEKKVEDLQKKILQDLCAVNLNKDELVATHHLDKIKECFATERVLVVIDDVTSRESLEALHVFRVFDTGSQCKVIVTGRDSGILPKYEKSGKLSIISVDGIKDGRGSDMQLFVHHAYKSVDDGVKESLRGRFQDMANDIVKLCNGLPLSLEVIGAYLGAEYKGDDEGDLCQWNDLWRNSYEKLQTAQSLDGSADDKLWSSLRVSYDGLAPLERAMFLDFACIFAFTDWEVASSGRIKRIWDSESGVRNLLNKSLLKERKDEGFGEGEFFMHDQLRDMGRYLLLKEEVKERPIYLWDREDYIPEGVRDLKDRTNGRNVPLVAGLDKPEGSQTPNYFSKLRMMYLGFNRFEPSEWDALLSECSGELRWLYLHRSRFTETHMQALGSLKGLRVLQMYSEDLVELPMDLSRLGNLVELELAGCQNLRSLPNSIGKLKKLKILDVSYCGLQSIPLDVGDLSKLEMLSFLGCHKITSGQNLRLLCADRLEELMLPFVPMTPLPPCPQLTFLAVQSTEEVGEFPLDFFKGHMPKLKFFTVGSVKSGGKIVLHNPDGSVLEISNNDVWPTVIRNPDGSIQKLSRDF